MLDPNMPFDPRSTTERLDVNFALKAAGLGVWEIDPLTNQVYWDERCQALVGLDKESILSFEQAIQYIYPDDLSRVLAAIQWSMNVESGGFFDETYRTCGADGGRLRWVHFWGQGSFTKTGKLYRFAGVAIDVTEQSNARQALKESQARLQSIIDLAELGSYSIDVTTNRITKSPRLAHWYGLSEQTEVAASLGAVQESDRARIGQVLVDILRPGSTGAYQVEYMMINQRTGQPHILRTNGQVRWDSAGRAVRIDGSVLDITAQREVQLALEQQVELRTRELAVANEELAASNKEFEANNEELEEANSLLIRSNDSLQQFAYVASHDLQEPLRKIQQFGELLRESQDSLSENAVVYINRMQSAASRMSILIRDLLNFSRVSTQRDRNDLVLLNTVVDEVLTALDLVITETKAEINVGVLPTIQGDASQLAQLFQNLLENALKFRRPGIAPLLQINAQLVEANQLPSSIKPARTARIYCRIDVVDNGIGFEEKYLDRMFEVFQRLHGKSEFAGSGIGLAICQRVVANHGGGITATSQPGKGATFCVYLPTSMD